MAREVFESCPVSLRDDGQQCIFCVSREREPAEDHDQQGLVVCTLQQPRSALLAGKLALKASTRSTGKRLFIRSLLAFFAKHTSGTSAHVSKQQGFSPGDEPNRRACSLQASGNPPFSPQMT